MSDKIVEKLNELSLILDELKDSHQNIIERLEMVRLKGQINDLDTIIEALRSEWYSEENKCRVILQDGNICMNDRGSRPICYSCKFREVQNGKGPITECKYVIQWGERGNQFCGKASMPGKLKCNQCVRASDIWD